MSWMKSTKREKGNSISKIYICLYRTAVFINRDVHKINATSTELYFIFDVIILNVKPPMNF